MTTPTKPRATVGTLELQTQYDPKFGVATYRCTASGRVYCQRVTTLPATGVSDETYAGIVRAGRDVTPA